MRSFKPLLPAAFAAVALLLSFASVASDKATAIYYHADWCPNCQALAPKFKSASSNLSDQLDILVMDYTNMETTGASQRRALELGLFEVIANNRHTGFVLLLDSDRNEVGRLYRTMDVGEIRQQLTDLASGS